MVDVAPLDVQHKHDLRWFAGALAHGSTDPVARAISRLAGPGRPTGVSQGPAHELRGAVDRHPVRIGVNGEGSTVGEVVGTTVRVDVDQRPMGHITVADEVRKTAAHCLSRLRDEGIEPILVSATMNKPELMRVSEQVGVSQFHTGTDASTVAASLPHGTTGVVRAVGHRPDRRDHPPERVRARTPCVRCANPSIESALESIQHARCLRRSRRVARTCAAAVIVLAVPLAASGLLSPTAAAIVATVGLVLVAAVASLTRCSPAPRPAPHPPRLTTRRLDQRGVHDAQTARHRRRRDRGPVADVRRLPDAPELPRGRPTTPSGNGSPGVIGASLTVSSCGSSYGDGLGVRESAVRITFHVTAPREAVSFEL